MQPISPTATEHAPLVYLDSSDYSALSSLQAPRPLVVVREELLALAQSKKVRFVFSATHLCEMAPLEARFTSAAVGRSNLLSNICQRNALLAFDRLLYGELSALQTQSATPLNIVSATGDWFPELGDILSPNRWVDLSSELSQAVKNQGVNRAQRRSLNRRLFKKKSPRLTLQQWMKNQDASSGLNEILNSYPMRPENAQTLAKYILGQETKAAAENAFLESLRDPQWMMQWMYAHHDKMNPIITWMREPAQNVSSRMRVLAIKLLTHKENLNLNGISFDSKSFVSTEWRNAFQQSLVSISNNLAKSFSLSGAVTTDSALVQKYCPGLTLALKVLYSALWDAISGSNPRTPEDSDFLDAVHAMYAPYVRVFRADRYMSPHVRKHADIHGTIVVSRLLELPDAIKSLL